MQDTTIDLHSGSHIGEVDASAILDGDSLHVEPAPLRIRLADREIRSVEIVTGDDAKAENSFEPPDMIRPQDFGDLAVGDRRAAAEHPPLSVVATNFALS